MERHSQIAMPKEQYFDYPAHDQYVPNSPDTFYGGRVIIQPPTIISASDSAQTPTSKPSRRTVSRPSQTHPSSSSAKTKRSSSGPSAQFRRERERQLANTPRDTLIQLSISKEHEAREAKHLLSTAILQIADLQGRLSREQAARNLAEDERQTAGVKTTQAILDTQMESMNMQEKAAMYKMQAETTERELQRARDVVRRVEHERDESERALVRARTQAREVKEQNVLLIAREEGRREGFDEGLRQGRLALTDDAPAPKPRKHTSPRKPTPAVEPAPPPPSAARTAATMEAEAQQAALREIDEREKLRIKMQLSHLERDLDRERQRSKEVELELKRTRELVRRSEEEKRRVEEEKEREKRERREAERDKEEMKRRDDEALRRMEEEKRRLQEVKELELEQLRREKAQVEDRAKIVLESEREKMKRMEEDRAREREREEKDRRKRDKEHEQDKEANTAAIASAAAAAVTAAIGAGVAKSSGSGRRSAMSNHGSYQEHQRIPYLPMPPPPSRAPMPSSPQSILMPSAPGATSGGMPMPIPGGMSMPQPSIPGGPSIIPSIMGGSSISYQNGASMMPQPSIPGGSSMGPAAMSMPQPSVPGGSSMGPAAMSMPQPSVPSGSSMGPAAMSMPQPSVPGESSMGGGSMTMPQATIPGGSSMGPAAMSMPQPSIPGGSSMGGGSMTMPQPSVPGGRTTQPSYQGGGSMTMPQVSTPGGSSMTMPQPGGPPMPQPTIPGGPTMRQRSMPDGSSMSNPSGAPGSGFPVPRAGSSGSQRGYPSRRMSVGSHSSSTASGLPLDMLQFERGDRDRDQLSVIHEDASVHGHSPSRSNTPGIRGSMSMGSNAPPPSWMTNPPLDYTRPENGGATANVEGWRDNVVGGMPRGPGDMGGAPVYPSGGYQPHNNLLNPNSAGPSVRRSGSTGSYDIRIEPPSRSPSSLGGPQDEGGGFFLSPHHAPAPLPQQQTHHQQPQPLPVRPRHNSMSHNTSGITTEPNSPVNEFKHLPPNFVPQTFIDRRGVSTPISSNPVLPGMGPVIPPPPVIPSGVYGNPLNRNKDRGHDSPPSGHPPPTIAANKSPFRPPIGLPSSGGSGWGTTPSMTPGSTTRDLPSGRPGSRSGGSSIYGPPVGSGGYPSKPGPMPPSAPYFNRDEDEDDDEFDPTTTQNTRLNASLGKRAPTPGTLRRR